MKKSTNRLRHYELKAIAGIPDRRIDTSDIPELTEAQLRSGTRSQMYRPIKKSVTMRLDADVIAWLKLDGPGYQTKANALLRQEMLRAHSQKKGPERDSTSSKKAKRIRS